MNGDVHDLIADHDGAYEQELIAVARQLRHARQQAAARAAARDEHLFECMVHLLRPTAAPAATPGDAQRAVGM